MDKKNPSPVPGTPNSRAAKRLSRSAAPPVMNIMKPAVVLIHEKSRAKEDWRALLTATFTVVGMIAFYCYFFSWLWAADPWFVIVAFAIPTAVTVGRRHIWDRQHSRRRRSHLPAR